MVPALNAPLEAMSAAEAAFVIRTAFLRDRDAARFGYSKVPLAQIMEAAARDLASVRRATVVSGIASLDGGVRVRSADAQDDVFDAIVLALPPRALQRVLLEPARFGVADLEKFEASAIKMCIRDRLQDANRSPKLLAEARRCIRRSVLRPYAPCRSYRKCSR